MNRKGEPGIEHVEVHCAVHPEIVREIGLPLPEAILAYFHEQRFPGGDGSGRTTMVGEQLDDFHDFAKETIEQHVGVVNRMPEPPANNPARHDRRPGWRDATEGNPGRCSGDEA